MPSQLSVCNVTQKLMVKFNEGISNQINLTQDKSHVIGAFNFSN